MAEKEETYENTLSHVNTYSKPSDLKITDMRFAEIVGGTPMKCTLMKIQTNQGLVGYGEIRDGASKKYALMLKSRLLGENPCNIDKIFRRIKQFGGQARQGGGVSGVEVALWDLAGKAYSIPVYQMLGGKFRDKVRIYCDTEVIGRSDAQAMGKALKKRIESGFTFLKMDLGIEQIINEPGTLSGPPDLLEDYKKSVRYEFNTEAGPNETRKRSERTRLYDINNLAHPFTGLHITQKGFDMLEKYVEEVRSLIGYEIPLAVDHFGHVGVEDAIKLAARMDKYNLAWLEDLLPWRLTDQYVRLSRSCTTPICTGEDIFLKENFRPLLEKGAVSIIHPDLLTSGGILENKKIGDMAQEYAAAMAIHMAESPVACMAAVHCAAATENFMVLENHSVDIPWWDDMVCGTAKPLVKKGFITVPDTPGLGIESLNDEIVREHINPAEPGMWEPTGEWDNEWSYDRLWS